MPPLLPHLAGCLLAIAALAAGCASVPPAGPLGHGPPTGTTVLADWDDVDASVGVAAGAAELAVIGRQEVGPGHVRFDLRSVLEEPGWLEARAVMSDENQNPVEIRITAQIGRFGRPAQEQRLVRALASRLTELRGVDYAPLR